MNFEQFDKYLAQLKEVLGQAADTLIRGVFAMNLSTIIFAVSALVLAVFASHKAKAIWKTGNFDSKDMTMDGLILVFWCVVSCSSVFIGVIKLTEDLWKILAPDFAAVDYILHLISKG